MYEVIAEIKKDHISGLVKENKRVDGRGFDEYRQVSVEKGVFSNAEGSSLVKIGDTQVSVGVKMAVGAPFSDMPDMGVLMTNAELIPLASPTFESGPPKEPTIELARVTDRAIRESGAVDLGKLCITPGEEVWMVFIDVHVLDYDGNLFDASALGSTAALIDAKMPKYEDGRVIYTEKKGSLPLLERPISTTFAKIGGGILLDPMLDEEHVMDARLTVSTTQKGELCAMQKGGIGTFTEAEILDTVDRGIKNAGELRKLL